VTIRCSVLGPVEVTVAGAAPPPELLWRKNFALLVYLARSPRRTRAREHLTALLWGDKPESTARHSLREAIRILRKSAGDGAVEAEGDRVGLQDGAVALDVDELESRAAAGDWAGAAALAVGDFLEGLGVPDAPAFEDWLAAERQAVRRRMVEALCRHGGERLDASDLGAAAEAARRALGLDGAANEAARTLMRALALNGDRAGALAVYEQLVTRMREAFGAEPDEATRHLADQVRRQRLSHAGAPAARGAESRRAPLVGRDAELARLLELWRACLEHSRATVVVLDGDAGLGRSRLLEEAAGRARLDGAAVATTRAVPADEKDAWSGCFALARGGLLEAGGVGGAPPGALASFAAVIESWADRFPGARGAKALEPRAALAAVVRAAAGEQPVVLVADDAQWMDAESCLALAALPRDVADLPVLLLVSAAPHPPRAELDALRARLGRDVPGAGFLLTPLGAADVRALARWAMPAYSEVEVDRLARRVAADSAGRPLLAVEILHAVALGLDLGLTPRAWPDENRTLDQTLPGGEVPRTAAAAIRVGFTRLSQDAQAVVTAAAAIGDRADAGTIARAGGLELARVTAALDELEWQRWLVADGRGYTFLAGLVRDVIELDMMTPGQRRRLREAAQTDTPARPAPADDSRG